MASIASVDISMAPGITEWEPKFMPSKSPVELTTGHLHPRLSFGIHMAGSAYPVSSGSACGAGPLCHNFPEGRGVPVRLEPEQALEG